MLTILRERNSTDLFMKVALVKVKVKSSAAFRRIVANKNNITVSCGSWMHQDRTSRPLDEKKDEICASINILIRQGCSEIFHDWKTFLYATFSLKHLSAVRFCNNNTFAVKVGCVPCRKQRHLGNCLDWFWVILDKEFRPRLSSLNK